MLEIFRSDLMKMKRKAIWFLIFLGPIGVIGLEAVNFLLRYDWLTEMYKSDLWGGLIGEAQSLAVPTLMIGITIIASMLANIEHQTNAWKQILAIPVTKFQVYGGKFALLSFLLFLSSTLLGIGIIALGLFLDFDGKEIPFGYLFTMIYYPFFSALPFFGVQLWLSIAMKNQAIPLTIGILGMILAMGGPALPQIVILPSWKSSG